MRSGLNSKRLFWSSLLFFLTLFTFASCNLLGIFDRAELIVKLSSESVPRTLKPDIKLDVVSYDIAGTGPGEATFSASGITDDAYSKDGLLAGGWTVVVTGKNSDGIAIVKSTSEVTLESGMTKELSVICLPITGKGSISLSISWPADEIGDPVVEASLTPNLGDAILLSVAEETEAITCTKEDVNNGYYILTIKLRDGEKGNYLVWSWNESVLIYADEETIGDWILTAEDIDKPETGTLSMGIGSDTKKPLVVTLSGEKAAITSGTTMTVSAEGTPAADEWLWYLDGDKLADKTESSVTIGSGLEANTAHTLVAIGKKGDVTGSAGIRFRVVDYPSNPTAAFSRHGNTPIMTPSESFDINGIYPGFVLREEGVFKMWYTGTDSSSVTSVCYATSEDGITWKKIQGGLLQPGADGQFDHALYPPSTVIHEDGLYKMWYTGGYGHASGRYNIGYATSPDGITWTKHSTNPLLPINSGFDSFAANTPSIIKVGSTYHMYYGGSDASLWEIGHATSADGINWTKTSEFPVITRLPGSFDSMWAFQPCVLSINGIFYLWYTGVDGINDRIGCASSTDGITWTRAKINPILSIGADGSWDSLAVSQPYIVLVDGSLYMYYNGRNSTQGGIGLAILSN